MVGSLQFWIFLNVSLIILFLEPKSIKMHKDKTYWNISQYYWYRVYSFCPFIRTFCGTFLELKFNIWFLTDRYCYCVFVLLGLRWVTLKSLEDSVHIFDLSFNLLSSLISRLILWLIDWLINQSLKNIPNLII